jgi:acetyl-CoA carboxylase carboxyl transferase subunit beta
VPEGLWVKCPGCSQVIYNKDLAANLSVCPKCAHHFRIGAPSGCACCSTASGPSTTRTRLDRSAAFTDTKPYKARLKPHRSAPG